MRNGQEFPEKRKNDTMRKEGRESARKPSKDKKGVARVPLAPSIVSFAFQKADQLFVARK
jgi:hypothetical protein